MIKKLHVQNFKSLLDTTFEPGPINVLVGRNSAGKSNVLDVLKFLTHVGTNGLGRAFGDRNGFTEVCWKGDGPSLRTITIDLTLEIPGISEKEPQEVLYTLAVEGSQTGLLDVKKERLRIKARDRWLDVIDMKSGHGDVRNSDGSVAFETPGNPSISMLEFNVPGWAGTDFRNYLASWRFYKLIPDLMKQIKAFSRAAFLNELGDNLVEYLTTIKTTHADAFRRLEQVVRDTFPETLELIPQPTQYGQVALTTRERAMNRPITVWQMADGELAFIALMSQPHPIYRRDGDDVHMTVPVAIHEAALGAKIEVPTPDGPVRLRVPPGTQSEQRFRLRERGAPSMRDGRRGDLVVAVRLVLPEVIDERSKELLREFGRLNAEDVRSGLKA